MKCPECIREGKRSSVTQGIGTTTLTATLQRQYNPNIVLDTRWWTQTRLQLNTYSSFTSTIRAKYSI